MHETGRRAVLAGLAALLGLTDGRISAAAETRAAGPADYLKVISDLKPGDHLRLQSGRYLHGIAIRDLHGAPGKPIAISGPPDRSAVFLGEPRRNIVDLRNVSYLEIRNLTLDGRNIPGVDGVHAHETTHHITLENLALLGNGAHQQTVGISTKGPAWDWTIRNSIVRGAGTGLYLGDADGSAPFVRGVIEHNVIADTIGYGLQIKHQNRRPDIAGLPTGRSSTFIRHNVISKAKQPLHGFQGGRPNLLVGHFPPIGPGAGDVYEIYGNLLHQNRVNEPLFQGEGNIAFHDNLLVNRHGDGIWIRPHNDVPKMIAIFHNTVVARGLGIAVWNPDPAFKQDVVGNAVFADPAIEAHDLHDNVTGRFEVAASYLKNPFGSGAELDLRPRSGRLLGPPLDLTPFAAFADIDKDCAGNPRSAAGDAVARGAYAGPDVDRGSFTTVPPEP